MSRTVFVKFRATPEEKERIVADALSRGYESFSDYVRDSLGLEATRRKAPNPSRVGSEGVQPKEVVANLGGEKSALAGLASRIKARNG